MDRIRVMQSFGAPRATTNPYIVMLRQSLMDDEDLEHLDFSWRTALTARYEILHVHWADTLVGARSRRGRWAKKMALAALLLRLRLTRTPVVRTVHNLTPTSGGRLARALEERAAVHIHIGATTPDTGRPAETIPHGHYVDWFAPRPKEEAVPGRVGYVGLIKPYKGLEDLVAEFPEARRREPGLTLAIAGGPSDRVLADHLSTSIATLEGASLTLRYLDEDEFSRAVTSAQVIALPYRHMHNSGAALAALSLGRAVLVPDNDANRALADEVGEEWVLRFDGHLSADDLVRAEVSTRDLSGRPDLSQRGWADAARRHLVAYRRALAMKSGAR